MSEESQDIAGEEVADAVDEGADDAPQLPSVEELAAELGWKPKDQWTGPEAEWRDPVTYIKYGQNATLVQQVKELKRSHETFVRTQRAETDRMLREQERQWQEKLDQAIEDGDKAGVREATRELSGIQQQRAAPEPTVEDWISRNPWFNSNLVAQQIAVAKSEELKHLPVSDQLAAAEAEVRKRVPELFEDEKPALRQRSAPTVSVPGTRTANPSRKDPLAGIPRDHLEEGRKTVADFQRRGFKNYTIEQWAATYKQSAGIAA